MKPEGSARSCSQRARLRATALVCSCGKSAARRSGWRSSSHTLTRQSVALPQGGGNPGKHKPLFFYSSHNYKNNGNNKPKVKFK